MPTCATRKTHPGPAAGPTDAPLPPPADPRLGTSVAGFTLERRVSLTELAAVYHGRRGTEEAAVKIHRGSADHAHRERIRREREAQRGLSHRCVARLLDWGVLPDGAPYLASEWVPGVRLEDRLAAGPLRWSALARILDAVGHGLHAIHAAGIVHRDLKPSNVMLPEPGEPAAVLLDFGHSLVLDQERLTEHGVILGSASYMAPEQVAGGRLDGRADLYALGVILYRALTGVLPFEHPSPAEVMRRHRWEPVVPPRTRAPAAGIAAVAEDLCLWLLVKDPAARVPNAHVLLLTLAALAQTAGMDAHAGTQAQ
jgi:serine/threonine-protein kinase